MVEVESEFLTLGVDLGGTKVVATLVDASGRILSEHRYPTFPELVDTVREYIRSRALKSSSRGLQIAQAKLGHKAGVAGGAAVARLKVNRF